MLFCACSRSDLHVVQQASRALTPSLCWAGQPHRELHRFDQARRIGDALARDVERGAVIDRRADDRQAQRDVDGAPNATSLIGISPWS